jgi:hypothetical protein
MLPEAAELVKAGFFFSVVFSAKALFIAGTSEGPFSTAKPNFLCVVAWLTAAFAAAGLSVGWPFVAEGGLTKAFCCAKETWKEMLNISNEKTDLSKNTLKSFCVVVLCIKIVLVCFEQKNRPG